MDAVKASGSVERDPFHRFCRSLGGEPHVLECRLPDGITVKWKARHVFDPDTGLRFEPHIQVKYEKEYGEVLGDQIADIVERATNDICTVVLNTEYDVYYGGSILVCSKELDVDHNYLRNTKRAIKEVREAARKAEKVIEEAKNVLHNHFK